MHHKTCLLSLSSANEKVMYDEISSNAARNNFHSLIAPHKHMFIISTSDGATPMLTRKITPPM